MSTIHGEIEHLLQKGYDSALRVAIYGVGDGLPSSITVQGRTIRIVTCSSTLQVHEHMSRLPKGEGLAVVTTCDDETLGPDLLCRFPQGRIRLPDAWDTALRRFGATSKGLDLADGQYGRDVAKELLNALAPLAELPAAPAGVLTASHAFGVVVDHWLGLRADCGTRDALRWVLAEDGLSRLAAFRASHSADFAALVLGWLGQQWGARARLLRELLVSGRTEQAVPLIGATAAIFMAESTVDAPRDGAEAQAFHEQRSMWNRAMGRLEERWATATPPQPAEVKSLAGDVTAVLTAMLGSRDDTERRAALRAIAQTDVLLEQVGASAASEYAPTSEEGLSQLLSRTLHSAAAGLRSRDGWPGVAGPMQAQSSAGGSSQLATMEHLWRVVSERALVVHMDSRDQWAQKVALVQSAVRVRRWLSTPDDRPKTLQEAVAAYAREIAYADVALGVLHRGVDEPQDGEHVKTLLETATTRRRRWDRAYAALLAESAGSANGRGGTEPNREIPSVMHIEDALQAVGKKLGADKPGKLLVLVLDGMSWGAAITVAQSMPAHWQEVTPGGRAERAAALTVFPSVTNYSRASLLSGAVCSGGQGVEREGFQKVFGDQAQLFHKADVLGRGVGQDVGGEVRSALRGDTKFVGVVLNTIDDALDSSEPGWNDWTIDKVAYLTQVLQAAAAGGRNVLMTSDHGHVVERRRGSVLAAQTPTSARSREPGGVVTDQEVQLKGDRVLPNRDAVLAVDEDVRYTKLKAGYHGGAAPVETIVPVLCWRPTGAVSDLDSLMSDSRDGSVFQTAPPAGPTWWHVGSRVRDAAVVTARDSAGPALHEADAAKPPVEVKIKEGSELDNSSVLFDLPQQADDSVEAPVAATTANGAACAKVGEQLKESSTFIERLESGAVNRVSADGVVRLVDACVDAPGGRVPAAVAAQALGVDEVRLGRLLPLVAELLNVDSYPVVKAERRGHSVIDVWIDEPLLREQFELDA